MIELNTHYLSFCKNNSALENEEKICIEFEIDYSPMDRVLFLSKPRIQTEYLDKHHQLDIHDIKITLIDKNNVLKSINLNPTSNRIKTQFHIGLLSTKGFIQTQLPRTLKEFQLTVNIKLNSKITQAEPQLVGAIDSYNETIRDSSVRQVFRNKDGTDHNKFCALKNHKIYCWGHSHYLSTQLYKQEHFSLFNLDTDQDFFALDYYRYGPDEICVEYFKKLKDQYVQAYHTEEVLTRCIPNDTQYKSVTENLLLDINPKATPRQILGSNNDPIELLAISKNWLPSYETYCASFSKARIKCWGRNEFGTVATPWDRQKFLSIEEARLLPFVQLGTDDLDIISLSVVHHTFCALLSNNRVKCWAATNRVNLD